MSGRHTPGPWEIVYSKQGYPYAICAPEQSPNKPGGLTDITRWASISMPSSDEGLANARLISAAPDLLAACEEFCRKVDAGEARSVRSYAQMAAAIEKARGQ